MAEDPRTRAHNEEMRQKRMREEKEAERRRGRKAEEEMRARMSRDYKSQQNTTGGSSGCAIVLAVMTSAPLAFAAFKWMA